MNNKVDCSLRQRYVFFALVARIIFKKYAIRVILLGFFGEIGAISAEEVPKGRRTTPHPKLMDKWESEHQFTDFINYDALRPWRVFTGLRNELNYAVMADGTVRLLGNLKKPMTVEEVYAAKNA